MTATIDPEKVRADFFAYKAALQNDQTLSPSGRATKIAAAAEAANDLLLEAAGSDEAALAAERQTLERRLLQAPKAGAGASAADQIAVSASYRDALQRAQMCDDSAELVALLDLATVTGDTILARAVLVVGMRTAAVDVVNAWIASNPAQEADVERLWDIMYNTANLMQSFLAAAKFVAVA